MGILSLAFQSTRMPESTPEGWAEWGTFEAYFGETFAQIARYTEGR